MIRRFLLVALLCAAPATLAQAPPSDWPAPGDGFDWQAVGDRPVKAQHLAFDDAGRLWAATQAQGTVAVLREPDDPVAWWESVSGSLRGGNRVVSLGLGDTVIVGEATTHRTLDGGETWTLVTPPCGASRALVAAPDDVPPGPWGPLAGSLFAGRDNLCRSTDRGATWTEVPFVTPPPSPILINDALVLPAGHAHAGRLVVATDERIHLSDETRSALTLRPAAGPSLFFPEHLAVMPSGRLLVTGIDPALPDVQAEISDDGGESWHSTQPLAEPPGGSTGAVQLAVVGSGTALAVTGRGIVYRTDDDGATWTVIGRAPRPTENHSVKHALLDAQGRLLVALSVRGASAEGAWVWRTASPVLVADEATPSAREAFGVSVRPNPSPPGTVTVDISQVSPSALTVEVYDAVGRRVASLFEGDAAGALSLSVDTSRWTPGVYTVRVAGAGVVTAETFTVVR